VDGIQYTTADEIPDLEVRSKVSALLSETTGDDFDIGFEANFEKEFLELQQETSMFPKLIGSIFLALAGVLLAISAWSAIQTVGTLSKEVAAPGRVVDLVEHRSTDSQSGQIEMYSYPVVEFSVPDGQRKVVELSEGSWPPAYKTSDVVTVLYDPDQTDNARIESFSSSLLLWLLPAITGFVGFVFLIVAVLVFRLQKASGRLREAQLSEYSLDNANSQ
jgi:hypothetical protein